MDLEDIASVIGLAASSRNIKQMGLAIITPEKSLHTQVQSHAQVKKTVLS